MTMNQLYHHMFERYCAHVIFNLEFELFRACVRQGYDLNRDAVVENILSTMGFMRATALGLRLQACGLLYAAIPCNSYSYMSSSLHKRTDQNPHGDRTRPFVVEGTCVAARTALIIILCISRSVSWFVENPSSSRLNSSPFFKYLLARPDLQGDTVRWPGTQTHACVEPWPRYPRFSSVDTSRPVCSQGSWGPTEVGA